MSNVYKMPSTTTSKIPLPKSSISSPSRSEVVEAVTPQSRIPVMKVVTPTTGLNKENISVDRPPTQQWESPGSQNSRLRSRIPDIRTKISPTKEIQDIDGGYKSDHSTKSGGSGARMASSSSSPGARMSSSRIPVSPARVPNTPSRIPLRSSVESLSAEELDWEAKEFHTMSRRLGGSGNAFMGPDEMRGRASSETRSSSNSSSSSSPHKRGRDPEVPPAKMRRTSPDGESVSPAKTRRPSPSKIPIAGSYVVKTANSSSNEDFLTPRGPAREPWLERPSDRDMKGSYSVQSELFHTAQESEDEFCDLVGGGGEGLAESELAEDFEKSENFPRKKGLHLDLGSKIPPPKARIPGAPNSAPVRNIPELNWSIAKEDQTSKNICSDDRVISDRNIRGSQSTSRLPDPLAEGDSSPPAPRTNNSTSRLPFLPLKEGGSSGSSTDSDGSSGDKERGRRKKNFEAFVMTGDRMINLAKTPANVDFQSKYYKQPLTDRSTRTLDTTFESLETPPAPPSLPASPVEGSSQNDLINQRQAVSTYY